MSRSNPTQHAVHPCRRWHEWHGSDGVPYHYDKEEKKRVMGRLPFTFLLLDQLSVITGWHDASDSGITSNEVRDTRTDIMTVRSFKGGILAEGLYQEIREKVLAAGGQFTSNIYIATKIDDALALASLKLHGAALRPWMDFQRENRAHLYAGAISITGFTEGKKGKITYAMPVFELKPASEATEEAAKDLDRQLQEYLAPYLAKTTVQVQSPTDPDKGSDPDSAEKWPEPDGNPSPGPYDAGQSHAPTEEDDIPF